MSSEDAYKEIIHLLLSESIALNAQVTRLQAGQTEQLKRTRAEAWAGSARHVASLACVHGSDDVRKEIRQVADHFQAMSEACRR